MKDIIYTLTIAVIVLVAPYMMLKVIFMTGKARNRHERKLRLHDFPKDQHQLRMKMN